MNKNSSQSFSTDSFHLACFLLSQSCALLSVDSTNSKRMVFVFEESDKRVQLTRLFLSHSASVEPHQLFSAQKDLKQLIYQNHLN